MKSKKSSLKKPLIVFVITLVLIAIVCVLIIVLGNKNQGGESSIESQTSEETTGLSGWQTVDGKLCYYDPDTHEIHKGWLEEGGEKWYLDSKTGEKVTGWQTIGGDSYYFDEDGKMQTGLVEYEGAKYVLDPETGIKITETQLVDGKLYVLNEDGSVQTDIYGSYNFEGVDYIMLSGVAYTGWTAIDGSVFHFENGIKQTDTVADGYTLDSSGYITGEPADYIMFEAEVIVQTITDYSMTLDEKLWTCFDYMQRTYGTTTNQRIPHYTEIDWPYVYAEDMFGPLNDGNCLSCGAAYAFLAKACGAEEVYACNSGGHGWAEVDGLVYDPEQYHDTDVNRPYAYTYDQLADSIIGNYFAAISLYETEPWMRVEITG